MPIIKMIRKIDYKIMETCTVNQFLRLQKGYSASLIKELKRTEDGICVNGSHIRTVDVLNPGDVLTVLIPCGNNEIPPTDLPIDILYRDVDLLIVNKKAFTVCHPSRNHQGDTLANAVSAYLKKENFRCTFRAVNRLDRDTTGCVVIALNKLAAYKLSGSIRKTYYALADGMIESSGTIDVPVFRPDKMNIRRMADKRGIHAVTHYKPIASFGGLTLLEIHPETGRTHQIRVHFSNIGYPLIGDTMYGVPNEKINHQCLHCGKVSFIHPVTEKKITVCAPLPEDWTPLLPKHFKRDFLREEANMV